MKQPNCTSYLNDEIFENKETVEKLNILGYKRIGYTIHVHPCVPKIYPLTEVFIILPLIIWVKFFPRTDKNSAYMFLWSRTNERMAAVIMRFHPCRKIAASSRNKCSKRWKVQRNTVRDKLTLTKVGWLAMC